MIETRTKDIAGTTYSVIQLGAKQGRQALARLVKLLGPAVAGLGDNADVTKAFSALAASITETDMDYFCDVFAPRTSVTVEGGKTPLLSSIFDVHFAGNYVAMCQWLVFCMEVNFGNFLEVMGSAAKSAVPTAVSS